MLGSRLGTYMCWGIRTYSGQTMWWWTKIVVQLTTAADKTTIYCLLLHQVKRRSLRVVPLY